MARQSLRWALVLVVIVLAAGPLPAVPRVTDTGEIVHDGEGTIDRIGNDGKIVIGDRLFRLSSQAVYYSAAGTPVSLTFFAVGDRVAYDLNPNGRLVALYEIKKGD